MGLVLTWTAMESLTTESPLPAPLSTDPASGADSDGPGPPLLVPEPLASMLMVMESLTTESEPAASPVAFTDQACTADSDGPGPPPSVPEPLASMLMVMESLTTMLEPAASTVQELASADTPDTAGAEDSSDRTDRPKRKTNIH